LAEYDRLIGEWLAAGRRLPASQLPDLSVADLIERFWAHVKTYYRRPDGTPTQEVNNYRAPLSILNTQYGATAAGEFGPLALEACRASMVAKGWCRRFVNRQTDRIKALFKWSVAKELVPSSVYESLRCVGGLRAGRSEARESLPVKAVSDEVVDTTLPHLSDVVAAMVQVQRHTGARPGEICSMRVGEIDQSGSIWTYRPATHKTAFHDHSRTIFLGPKAQAVLRGFLRKLDPLAFVFSPADAVAEMRQRRSEHRKTPTTCGNIRGSNRKRRPRRKAKDHYDVASYRRAIARAADAADLWAKGGKVIANVESIIPRWHPHQLRHSTATEVRKRFGIEAAQHILGHANLSVTEIYAERNSEAARQIAAQIG
jgi:integrase